VLSPLPEQYHVTGAPLLSQQHQRSRMVLVTWRRTTSQCVLQVWLWGKNIRKTKYSGTVLERGIGGHVSEQKTFLLGVTVTMMLLTQTSDSRTDSTNCWATVPVVPRFTVGYDKQSHPISIQTLSHLAFWPQMQEDKLNQWANYKDTDTSHYRHWLTQCQRVRCCVCVQPKTAKRGRNWSVTNATRCVLLHVSKYITPDCISGDQLTIKWKCTTRRCQ
jgi:hypothetical protein